MSYFRKFKHFSNVLIRIPPLFVIDSVLNGTLLKIVYQSVHPDYSVFPITTWAQLFQWLATSFTSQYLYILFCCCLRCPCQIKHIIRVLQKYSQQKSRLKFHSCSKFFPHSFIILTVTGKKKILLCKRIYIDLVTWSNIEHPIMKNI